MEKPVNPCGLVALSYFNDTYKLWNNGEIEIKQDGIAWSTDVEKKFKRAENAETT